MQNIQSPYMINYIQIKKSKIHNAFTIMTGLDMTFLDRAKSLCYVLYSFVYSFVNLFVQQALGRCVNPYMIEKLIGVLDKGEQYHRDNIKKLYTRYIKQHQCEKCNKKQKHSLCLFDVIMSCTLYLLYIKLNFSHSLLYIIYLVYEIILQDSKIKHLAIILTVLFIILVYLKMTDKLAYS